MGLLGHLGARSVLAGDVGIFRGGLYCRCQQDLLSNRCLLCLWLLCLAEDCLLSAGGVHGSGGHGVQPAGWQCELLRCRRPVRRGFGAHPPRRPDRYAEPRFLLRDPDQGEGGQYFRDLQHVDHDRPARHGDWSDYHGNGSGPCAFGQWFGLCGDEGRPQPDRVWNGYRFLHHLLRRTAGRSGPESARRRNEKIGYAARRRYPALQRALCGPATFAELLRGLGRFGVEGRCVGRPAPATRRQLFLGDRSDRLKAASLGIGSRRSGCNGWGKQPPGQRAHGSPCDFGRASLHEGRRAHGFAHGERR